VWWSIAAALLTVGAYALTWGGAVAVDALNKRDVSPGRSFTELNDVAAIWFERNVLLDNEPWPGGVMIVRPVGVLVKERKGKKGERRDRFVLFPDSGEVRVGKDGEATIQAMAYEFALYDRNVKGRWRPVTLEDLHNKTLDVGEVPAVEDLPDRWLPIGSSDEERQNPAAVRRNLPIEDIRYYADKPPQPGEEHDQKIQKQNLKAEEAREQISRVIDRLRELADNPDLSRKFRRLRQPKQVRINLPQGDKEMEQGTGKADEHNIIKTRNVYEHKIAKLTSTTKFTIRADDYESVELQLLMVPPPRMVDVYSEPAVPAYLYHLPEIQGAGVTMPSLPAELLGQAVATPFAGPLAAATLLPPDRALDDDQRFLAPRKQRLVGSFVNVAGASSPEVSVPAGSDLTLEARIDKPLSTARADDVVVKRKESDRVTEKLPQRIDDYRFRITLSDVRQDIELTFEFTDTDGDSGKQTLVVKPTADERPLINQFIPDVVRMVEDKYIVTGKAVIPFKIVVNDDFGLSSVEYTYSVHEAASQSLELRRVAAVAGAIGMTLRGPDAPLSSLVHNFVLPASLSRSQETITGVQPLARFQAEFDAQRARTIKEIDQLLTTPLPRDAAAKSIRNYLIKEPREYDAYLNDPEADVDRSKPFKGFNVGEIRRQEGRLMVPLAAPEGQLQKNYLMLVALKVRDTNVHRPGRGNRDSSQQYPFLIVSDTELLFQISLEEQRLFDELKKSFDDLEKARAQLSTLRFDIPAQPGARGVDFVGFSVRAEEIDKGLRETLRVTTKVHADYDRILREMRTNRIHEGSKRQIAERVKDHIVLPLGKVKEGDFPYAQEACTSLRRSIDNTSKTDLERLAKSRADAEAAEKEMDRVLNSLREILVHMQGIVEIGKLIAKIRELEQREQASLDEIKRRIAQFEDEIFRRFDTEKADKVIGTWEVTKGEVPEGSTFEFTKDGKLKLSVKGTDVTAEGTYSVDGDSIKTTQKQGEKEVKQTLKIKKVDDRELIIEDEKGKTIEMKRK
ncbi:MAG TPA: hypothetical protein VKD72_38545, partial [Gemmataceae bacterium]|nr:hypothetical protein [Gemmataceae bacterium]